MNPFSAQVAEDGDGLQLHVFEAGGIVASARLQPAIGLDLPRFWYHVGCTVHAAPELQLFHRQRTLLLGNDHTGASELARLQWRRDDTPLEAQAAALRLLVDTALLAMARQRSRFAAELVVELPGLRDAAGQSPFWDGLGRHFFSGDPHDAEAAHGEAWRSHVAALLPQHTLIAGFLQAAAQAAIAQVAPEARLLRELLEAAGLRYSHHVCVDDGGPVLAAELDALPAVTQARTWQVADGTPEPGPSRLLLTAAGLALRAPATASGALLMLAADTRLQLGLAPGDRLWAL